MIGVLEGVSYKGSDDIWEEGEAQSRYVGQYLILRKVCNIACELDLPSTLGSFYLVFHVSMLKKCVGHPSLVFLIESVGILYSLSYKEVPVKILDRQVRRLRAKYVAL